MPPTLDYLPNYGSHAVSPVQRRQSFALRRGSSESSKFEELFEASSPLADDGSADVRNAGGTLSARTHQTHTQAHAISTDSAARRAQCQSSAAHAELRAQAELGSGAAACSEEAALSS